MKVFILTVFLAISGALFSQSSGNGIGVIVGNPTGVVFKSWLNSSDAIDVAAAWSLQGDGYLTIHADYLMHDTGIFKRRNLPVFYGLGAAVGLGNDASLGIRVVLGIDYYFSGSPFDLFVEVAPTLLLTPASDFDFQGAIGFRYFF